MRGVNGATQLMNHDVSRPSYCLIARVHLFYVLLGVPEAPASLLDRTLVLNIFLSC